MWDQKTIDAVKLALNQPLKTITDVLKIQGDLGSAFAGLTDPLTGDNPVKSFNDLYIAVTKEVEAALQAGQYLDGPFMEVLDVEFARLYFQAISDYADGKLHAVSWAWEVLFDLKDRNGETLTNFEGALLGVNAHINFDLTEALLEAVKKDPPGSMPDRRIDFDSINEIFERLMDPLSKRLIKDLRNKLTQSIVIFVDWMLGDLDEDITLALIKFMRDQAWWRAEMIWAFTGGPGDSVWDTLVSWLGTALMETGEFDRGVEGIEQSLGRASETLFTSDLLLIEPLSVDLVRVTSTNRQITGEWVGEKGDIAGLLTSDWLKQISDGDMPIAPGPEYEQLVADLQLINSAHQPSS